MSDCADQVVARGATTFYASAGKELELNSAGSTIVCVGPRSVFCGRRLGGSFVFNETSLSLHQHSLEHARDATREEACASRRGRGAAWAVPASEKAARSSERVGL